MTIEDTKRLLAAIDAIYPTFDVENPNATVEAWHWALEEYPVEAVKAALQIYIKSNNTGFAPSVSQLIGCMYKPKENAELTEGEAWMLVKRAIGDSFYHAEERFEQLPPLVQRAVGNPSMLRQWGQTDSDEVNSVIMSNFQRTYRTLLSKQAFSDKIPPQLSQVVSGLVDKVSGDRLLTGGD